MVAVEDVLTDSLSNCVKEWFESKFDHPFLNVQAIVVPDSVKPIPKRWVDDIEVQIDEGFGGEADDVLGGLGPGNGWSFQEGRERLRVALGRLNLNEEHVAHTNLHRMTRNDLMVEKRRVKQELKRYDADFRKQFMRLPSHMEKEPMRPLYVYYRRLKTMITHAEQNKGASRQPSMGSMNGSDDEGMILGANRELSTIPDSEETPRSRNTGRHGNSVETQVAAIEARIESLQIEKGTVRSKLQSFQENFFCENNRKIKFHKDILPIEREYRLYKNLKEEILKAEQQLRALKSDSGAS